MKIIIANTDVGALLKATDAVLAKYNGDVHTIPENVKGQAVLSVLKNMLQNKQHFDICAVRELAKLNDITISPEHMQLFTSLHCVNWNEMHPDTREYIGAILVHYFKGNIVLANSVPS